MRPRRDVLQRIRVHDTGFRQRLHLCAGDAGELVAWIIGWSLVLEYALGAATVSVSWSSYVVDLFNSFGLALPAKIPLGTIDFGGVLGIVPSPRRRAILIIIAVSLVLMRASRNPPGSTWGSSSSR